MHATPRGHAARSHFRSEDREGEAWQRFAEEVPIEDGRFDLCFSSPDPDLSGVVRVRIDVIAEDGAHAHGYSPDTMVVVGTKAACTESASVCCKAQMPAEPAPMQGGAGAMAAAAGTSAAAGGAMAQATAGTPANVPPPNAPADTNNGDGGCGVARTTPSTTPIALLLAWLALIRRRLRRPC